MWEVVAGAAISGLAGALGSNSAAKAQERAAKDVLREQQRALGVQLGLNEPARYLGYNAMNDIATEFGYGMAPWASATQLNEPTMDASAIIKAMQRGLSFDEVNAMGRLGTMNAREMDKLTKYGLTAEQIQQLQAVPGSTGAGGVPATGRGFTASPDYQFRRDEGMRDLGNSFAARGGAFSGNALRALTDYNSNLASGEYGNWFNRRAALAGMGQTAVQNVGNATQNYANAASNAHQAQGDARASGILGAANSLSNSINAGLQYGILSKYLGQQQLTPNYYGGSFTGATRGYA